MKNIKSFSEFLLEKEKVEVEVETKEKTKGKEELKEEKEPQTGLSDSQKKNLPPALQAAILKKLNKK